MAIASLTKCYIAYYPMQPDIHAVMSGYLEFALITCPYCGENIEIQVDCSAGSQKYIEDCQVCCSPIEISLQISSEGGIQDIRTNRDSD